MSESLDAKYGYITAFMVHFYYTGEVDSKGSYIRKKEKIPLEMVPCGTQYYNYENQNEVVKYGISKLNCFKNDNYQL